MDIITKKVRCSSSLCECVVPREITCGSGQMGVVRMSLALSHTDLVLCVKCELLYCCVSCTFIKDQRFFSVSDLRVVKTNVIIPNVRVRVYVTKDATLRDCLKLISMTIAESHYINRDT